jgi:hypothetical protein
MPALGLVIAIRVMVTVDRGGPYTSSLTDCSISQSVSQSSVDLISQLID